MPASGHGSDGGAGMNGRIAHGGRVGAARAAWPDAPEAWIDLSTGINPWPYPVGSIDAEAWTRLPDPQALAGLEAAMAAAFGVAAERVIACAGSEAALRLLPLLRTAPARVGIAAPTYASHADAWAGHDVRCADLAGLIADIDALDVLVVTRPNNPDGAMADPALLAHAAAALAARGGWLVLDEAFADAMSGASLATQRWAAEAIVLRSFGKSYGLAGLRLGAVIAPPALTETLRHRLGDWPVSGAAVTIGTRAYRDGKWLVAAQVRLAQTAARLDALLGAHGLAAHGRCPLFRLIDDPRAPALHAGLAARAILTRAFAERPHWLRFGLPGDDADWTRLALALQECMP